MVRLGDLSDDYYSLYADNPNVRRANPKLEVHWIDAFITCECRHVFDVSSDSQEYRCPNCGKSYKIDISDRT